MVRVLGKDAQAVAWEAPTFESFYPTAAAVDTFTARAYGCCTYTEAKKQCGGLEVAGFRRR